MRKRRSLSQAGGRCRLWGDPALAAVLARCVSVSSDARLPFTHGFHSYPARMHPETARRALAAFPAARVFDPFVGSGTTLLEALLAGALVTGFDVSRIALEIAWVRSRAVPPEACRRLADAAGRAAGYAQSEGRRPFELPPWARQEREWYAPHTLREIGLLQARIEDMKDDFLRRVLRCVLSSIVVKLSRQAGDSVPGPDRRSPPRPPGLAFHLFRRKAEELARNLRELNAEARRRRLPWTEPELRLADSRTELPPGPVDLVLTSPPYAGTYDYAAHQARRYVLYGDDAEFARAHEIGSRRDPGRYREDMEEVLRNAASVLAPEGRILLLVGDGRIGKERFAADRWLREAAPRLGLRVRATASQARPAWDGGGAREEHLVLMQR